MVSTGVGSATSRPSFTVTANGFLPVSFTMSNLIAGRNIVRAQTTAQGETTQGATSVTFNVRQNCGCEERTCPPNQCWNPITCQCEPCPPPPCCPTGTELRPPTGAPSVINYQGVTGKDYNDINLGWNAAPTGAGICDGDGYEWRIRGATARRDHTTGLDVDVNNLNNGRHLANVRRYKNCPDGQRYYSQWGPTLTFDIQPDDECEQRGIDPPTMGKGTEGPNDKSRWSFPLTPPDSDPDKLDPQRYRWLVLNSNGSNVAEGNEPHTVREIVATGLTTPGPNRLQVFSQATNSEGELVESCEAEVQFSVREINLCEPINVECDMSSSVFRPLPLAPNVAPISATTFTWDEDPDSDCDPPDGWEWLFDGPGEKSGVINSRTTRMVRFENLQRELYNFQVRAKYETERSQYVRKSCDFRNNPCGAPTVRVTPNDGITNERTVTITPSSQGTATSFNWEYVGTDPNNTDSGTTTADRLTFPISGLRPDTYSMNVTQVCGEDADSPVSAPGATTFVVEGNPTDCLTPEGLTGSVSEVSLTSWNFNFRKNAQGMTPAGYQYKLGGANAGGWIDHPNTNIELSNLNPGKSSIEVRAICTNDEGGRTESQATAPFNFEVADPNSLCRPDITGFTQLIDPTSRDRTMAWTPCAQTDRPQPTKWAWRLTHDSDESLNQEGEEDYSTREREFSNLFDGNYTFFLKGTRQLYKDTEEDSYQFEISGRELLGTPVLRYELNRAGTSATIEWDDIEGADHYYIRLVGSPGTIVGEAKRSHTKATIISLSVGTEYKVYVKACEIIVGIDPSKAGSESCGNEGQVTFTPISKNLPPGSATNLVFGELQGGESITEGSAAGNAVAALGGAIGVGTLAATTSLFAGSAIAGTGAAIAASFGVGGAFSIGGGALVLLVNPVGLAVGGGAIGIGTVCIFIWKN